MVRMRPIKSPLLVVLLVAGCQKPPEPGDSRGSTTPRYERPREDSSPLEQALEPVRIGELGPNFPACETRGTTRGRSAEALVVRAAPYQAAREVDRLPAGAQFFVCSRSLDQKWFGLVYDSSSATGEPCGVSRPVPSRRDYDGPCRSGWVASVSVRLAAL